MNDSIDSIYTDSKYQMPVEAAGVGIIKQEISCGYACIQLISQWSGGGITEQKLYDYYGGIVTSTGKSFEEEINRQIPSYQIKIYKNLKNTEIIDYVYQSLRDGIPVPCEMAAYYTEKESWTLHYVIITGMDISNDRVTVSNPYGYMGVYTLAEFLNATRFDSYKKMPIFLKLAFGIDIFEKNTIFIMKRI